MHGINDILGWTQARYDDGYLKFHARFHIFEQASVTRVRNLIDGIGGDRLVGVSLSIFSHLVLNSL